MRSLKDVRQKEFCCTIPRGAKISRLHTENSSIGGKIKKRGKNTPGGWLSWGQNGKQKNNLDKKPGS